MAVVVVVVAAAPLLGALCGGLPWKDPLAATIGPWPAARRRPGTGNVVGECRNGGATSTPRVKACTRMWRRQRPTRMSVLPRQTHVFRRAKLALQNWQSMSSTDNSGTKLPSWADESLPMNFRRQLLAEELRRLCPNPSGAPSGGIAPAGTSTGTTYPELPHHAVKNMSVAGKASPREP